MNAVKVCSVDGCDRPVQARGWCFRHWKRWRKYGNPQHVVNAVKPWTDDEVEVVRRCRHLTAEATGKKLGRSADSVAHIRRELARDEGIHFGKGRADTDPHFIGSRPLLAKTCIRCGLLLEASWFVISKKQRTYRSKCTRCHNDTSSAAKRRWANSKRASADGKHAWNWRVAATQKRLNDITRERASNHRQPWLEGDHTVLADSTLTAFEKAITLGRTLSSVKTACLRNGYTSRVGKGDPMAGAWWIDNPNAADYTRGAA